jgi:LPS-assembly protein
MRMLSATTTAIAERPGAFRYTRTGSTMNPVVITCDDTVIEANEIVYEDDTRVIHASGNVVLQQGNLTLFAERAEMNRDTKLGTFFGATGFARIGDTPTEKSQFGTMEGDVQFFGEEVSKTGPATYLLRNGGFTTCVQPTPRWQMSTSTGTITLDKRAVLRNVVLRVKDVPLLYLPAIYYPINKEDRSTGFLLPQYEASSARGTTLSNAFFWAIDRSQDATFFHSWHSKTGQSYGGEYRYVPAEDSRGQASFDLSREQLDTGTDVAAPTQRSYRIEAEVNHGLPRGFRLIGFINYFSDIERQQYFQGFSDYAATRRTVSGTLSGSLNRLRISVLTEQTDYFTFESEGDGDDIEWTETGQRTGRRPSVNLALADKPIGRSRVYFGASGEFGRIVNEPDLDDPTQDLSLWRADGGPAVRWALSTLPYLNATAAASWRVTYWSQLWDEANDRVDESSLARQLFTVQLRTTGPIFARIFQTPDNRYADRFKHVIEPTFGLRRTTAFNQLDRIIRSDAVDSQVGGTTSIDYGLRNRILARRAQADGATTPGAVREIAMIELTQSYYTDALAQVNDPQNYKVSVGNFSPLRLSSSFRPIDNASADFRMDIDSTYRAVRDLSATGRVDHPRVTVNAGWSRRLEVPGLPGYGADQTSHFLNAATTLKTRSNRLGGTYAMSYDLGGSGFVSQRILGYYNSQCCGLSFTWQSVDTPLLNVPSDQRLGLSFTLAGIGSFSNPFGSFGP